MGTRRKMEGRGKEGEDIGESLSVGERKKVREAGGLGRGRAQE